MLPIQHLIVIAVFFLVTNNSYSQTIQGWLKSNENITENTHCIERYSKKYEDYKKFSESKRQEAEKKMDNLCLAKIAKKINFPKGYLIPSDVHHYYEKKDKELYAIVVIDKESLSAKLRKILLTDLKSTDSKLSTYENNAFKTSGAASAKVNEVSEMLKKNNKFKRNLILLNENVDLSDVEDYITSINSKINELQTKYSLKAKSEDINRAKSLLVNNSYVEAYKAFLNLNIKYPQVEEILQGKDEAMTKLKLLYDNRIDDLIEQKQYQLAVLSIDTLTNLDISFGQEYREQKKELNNSHFSQIINRIETQLEYSEPSPKNLKSLMLELKPVSFIDKKKYTSTSKKVEAIILDFEIKNIKSLQYNKKNKEALRGINELKKRNQFYDKRVDKLENKLERKVSSIFRKSMLINRCNRVSIEPQASLMFPEIDIENISEIQHNNANLMYSAGIYYRFNRKKKNSSKSRFSYSQIGIKIDYLDNQDRYIKNDEIINFTSQESYINPQISLNLRKCLQVDLGMVSYGSNSTLNSNLNFNGGLTFYIPFHYFSMGIASKYITDFKSKNTLSVGYSFKINLGMSKKYTKQDKNEIKTKMMQIKNQ